MSSSVFDVIYRNESLASPSSYVVSMCASLLASHFLQLIGARLNMPGHRLSKGDMARLRAYDWPGNIRELQNVIERALITATGAELNIDLPNAATSSQVDVTKVNSDGAAELLGIKPTTLASRLKKLGIVAVV